MVLYWQINPCLQVERFKHLDEIEMSKSLNWVNIRLLYSSEKNFKKSKIDHHLHLSQQIEAKYKIK